MALVGAIGGLAFVLASLVVGVRLLLLARRTRGLPELSIGLALFLMGGCGYPLTAVARLATSLSDEARAGLFGFSLVLAFVGITSACLFNWRVFRRHDAWATALVAGIAVTQVGFIVLQCVTPGLRAAALHNEGVGLRLFTAMHAIPLGWAALESLRYSRLMARRSKLGLGDPVVADRMRLWAMGMFCALLINLASTTAALNGQDLAATTSGALVIAPLGLLASSSVWLAFLPPKAYLRWVAARAAATA
jgi:hypothetical protein